MLPQLLVIQKVKFRDISPVARSTNNINGEGNWGSIEADQKEGLSEPSGVLW